MNSLLFFSLLKNPILEPYIFSKSHRDFLASLSLFLSHNDGFVNILRSFANFNCQPTYPTSNPSISLHNPTASGCFQDSHNHAAWHSWLRTKEFCNAVHFLLLSFSTEVVKIHFSSNISYNPFPFHPPYPNLAPYSFSFPLTENKMYG